jgi:hypothetical protein
VDEGEEVQLGVTQKLVMRNMAGLVVEPEAKQMECLVEVLFMVVLVEVPVAVKVEEEEVVKQEDNGVLILKVVAVQEEIGLQLQLLEQQEIVEDLVVAMGEEVEEEVVQETILPELEVLEEFQAVQEEEVEPAIQVQVVLVD